MLRKILDLSEVWALLIPLFALLIRKKAPRYLKPVRIYIWAALVINVCIILIQEYKKVWFKEGDFLWSNNFLYNIHSIMRLLLFSWFFILLQQRFMHRVKEIMPFLFLAFVIVNFTFYENFFNHEMLSSRLLAAEAGLLLFYCLQYFIFLLQDDQTASLNKRRGFFVVTGLSIYFAVNFFIFLFYTYLIQHDITFAISIWDVHNIAYVFLCICMAIAFYQELKNE